MKADISQSTIGPPAAREYPVEPVGVAMMSPSLLNLPATVLFIERSSFTTFEIPALETTASLRPVA